jgi:hypothetical protein
MKSASANSAVTALTAPGLADGNMFFYLARNVHLTMIANARSRLWLFYFRRCAAQCSRFHLNRGAPGESPIPDADFLIRTSRTERVASPSSGYGREHGSTLMKP